MFKNLLTNILYYIRSYVEYKRVKKQLKEGVDQFKYPLY